jgi:hypothetical protein
MRRIFGGVATVVAALVILGLAAAWRISAGPVHVAALTPLIEGALGELDANTDVHIGATWIEWAGWSRFVEVRLDDTRLVDAGGTEIARVPRLDVELSAAALLQGDIALAGVTVHRPSLSVQRGEAGFTFGILDGDGVAAVSFVAVERLLAPPDPAAPGGRLERFDIVDATVVIEDSIQQRRWTVPASAARLWRVDGGVDGELFADIIAAGERADVTVFGGYRREQGTWEIAVAFGDVRPGSFATLAPAISLLDAADVPVNGTVTLSGTVSGAVTAVGFDVSAGAGTLTVPPALVAALGGPDAPHPIAVESLSLRGRWIGADERLEVSAFTALVAPDGPAGGTGSPIVHAPIRRIEGRGRYLVQPALLEWDALRIDMAGDPSAAGDGQPGAGVPLRSVVLSGFWSVDDHRIEIPSLVADLRGPILTAAATVSGPAEARTVSASASLSDVKLDDLATLWPERYLANARHWVTGHLSDGTVPAASVEVAVTVTPDGLILDALSGSLTFDNVTVDYLPPLPPVRGAGAVATLGRDAVTFDITSGTAAGVAIDRATVTLAGLDSPTSSALIEVAARGPVSRVLEIIDSPPLQYAQAVGIDPAGTAGDADVRLSVSLPLVADLPIDRVGIYAEANLSDVRLANVVLGRDIHARRLALKIDNNGLELAGSASLAAIEGTILARETFTPETPVRRQIRIDVPAAELAAVQQLFFAEKRLPEDLLSGKVRADIHIAQRVDETARIDAELDFVDATANVPYFGWSKAWGAPARARISAAFTGNTLRSIPDFAVDADGLHLQGAATFDAEERIERIDLARVVTGRTDASGAFALAEDGAWSVDVRGQSIDFEPLLADLNAEALADLSSGAADTSVALTADVDTVWIDREQRLRGLRGKAVHADGLLRSAEVEARVDGDHAVAARLGPDGTGNRALTLRADDAGATLRTLGLFDSMTGGVLTVDGVFDDTRPSRPLSGQLFVRDYHVRDAPALAQFLGMLALTEIGNTLSGEGLSFRVLDVPFTYADGLFTIREARASGLALGFTGGGTVDLKRETLDLRGTVIPVYALNSALGRLPVVGYLFRGDQKGGGVFAATYVLAGPFDDVGVMVNPLAALTPGFLRHVFDVFEPPVLARPRDELDLPTAAGAEH